MVTAALAAVGVCEFAPVLFGVAEFEAALAVVAAFVLGAPAKSCYCQNSLTIS